MKLQISQIFKGNILLVAALILSIQHILILATNKNIINIFTILLLLLSCISRFQIAKTLHKIGRNITQIMIWSYLELGFFSYVFIKSFIEPSAEFFPTAYNMGQYGLILFALCAQIAKKIPLHHGRSNDSYPLLPLKTLHIATAVLLLIAFSSSILSMKLGITLMGHAHPIYPYKIEPALNLFRGIVVPVIFIIFMDYFLEHKFKKFFATVLICFLGWLFYESYIRESRGVVFVAIIQLIFLLFFHLNIKTLLKWSLIMVIIAISSFITVQAIRMQRSEYTAQQHVFTKNMFWGMYQRLFYDVELIKKFIPYTKNKFVINNMPMYRQNDGGVLFHTRIIDGHDPDSHHSSGITGLSDGFLLWGKLGFLITLFIIQLLSFINDRRLVPIFNYSNGIVALNMYWIFSMLYWGDGFWSFFLFRSPMTTVVYPA